MTNTKDLDVDPSAILISLVGVKPKQYRIGKQYTAANSGDGGYYTYFVEIKEYFKWSYTGLCSDSYESCLTRLKNYHKEYFSINNPIYVNIVSNMDAPLKSV